MCKCQWTVGWGVGVGGVAHPVERSDPLTTLFHPHKKTAIRWSLPTDSAGGRPRGEHTTGRAKRARGGAPPLALSPSPRYVKSWPSDRSSFVKTWRGASGGRVSEQHPEGTPTRAGHVVIVQ